MNARLAAWWQRFLDRHAPIIQQPDIGTDDDDDHGLDPNECRCEECAELVERIRARIRDEWRRQAIAREDLRECEAIAALPVRGGAR